VNRTTSSILKLCKEFHVNTERCIVVQESTNILQGGDENISQEEEIDEEEISERDSLASPYKDDGKS
jgi:hypothetical protein